MFILFACPLLGNASVPHGNDLSGWLSCIGTGKSRDTDLQHKPFDVYVIGVQEAQINVDKFVKRINEAFSSLGFENKLKLVRPTEYSTLSVC